jgi:hypothetical protein
MVRMSEKQTILGSERKKKRVVIYDFDQTIFHSLASEEGKALYFKATGQLWPFSGWYGRIETLMPPLVPDPIPESMLVANTVAAYREDRKCPDTYLVLMTGRPAKMRNRILEICGTFDLKFDEEFFRGMKGYKQHDDTLKIKLDIITEYLIHDGLEILEIWEDRPEHSNRFMTEARRWKSNTLQKIVVHAVQHGDGLVSINSVQI